MSVTTETYQLEQVHAAIQTLYSSQSQNKQEVDTWLKQFRKSAFAWQVADAMLTTKLSKETCFFAAQTLKTKLIYDIHELPQEAYQGLRDSLLDHLEAFAKSDGCPNSLITQLILAIVDLTLQMPGWKTPVQDMIKRYRQGLKRSERPRPKNLKKLKFLLFLEFYSKPSS